MKKTVSSLLITLLLTLPMAGFTTAQEPVEEVEKSDETVELTKKQRKELAKLYREIFDMKKEVVAKYVEFGVLTKEQGKGLMEEMDEHYARLERHGFLRMWHRGHQKPEPSHQTTEKQPHQH